MLWSTLSNALLKSTNKARTEPFWSWVWHHEWRIEIKAWAVDRPFMFPNWFGSRTGVSMSWSQSATKDSKTLASVGASWTAGGPSMAMTRRRLHSSNYAVSEQVVKPRQPRGEPLNSAPADRRVRSQCLVSSLASDVAFSETVQCWCYSKLMLVWVVRFINFGVTMSQSQNPIWEYLCKVDVT